MNEEKQQVVVDSGKGSFSNLWKREDYWAIWLGFFILILGMIIYFPSGPEGFRDKIAKANATLKAESERAPFKTIAWYQAGDTKKKLRARDSAAGKAIGKFTGKPHGWRANPADSFYRSKSEADVINASAKPKYEDAKAKDTEALAAAKAAEAAAAAAGFKEEKLNQDAQNAISGWRKAQAAASKAKSKASYRI